MDMEKLLSEVCRESDSTPLSSMLLTENNYKEIFDNSAIAITVTDAAENIVGWNKIAETLLGMGRDDLFLKPVRELYPPEEWQKIRSNNIRQKGMYHHIETRIINKKKEIVDVALSISVLKGPDGTVQGSIGILRDISESKKAEYALQESMELSRGMIETASTAIFLLKDGCFTFANHVMEDITGYSSAELMEIKRLDLINPGHREQAESNISQVSATNSRAPMEFRIFRKDLETAWVSERLTRIAYKGQEQILGNWMDITEFKVAEEISRYHSRQTELLLKIGSTVGQSLNLKDVIENFLDSLSQMIQERPVAFFFLPADSDSLDLISHRGFSEEFVKRMSRIKLGKGFIGRVAITGLSLVLNPTYYDPRFDPAILERDNLWSLCSVPIFARDKIKGVICVGSRSQQQAPDEETQLFELIASQIGIAIDNALLYEKTVEMAFTDGLTGLYNRRYLLEEMERELSRANRDQTPFSVVSMDIDNLKMVNDRWGHNYGDSLIKAFGEIIQRVSRKTDIAARTGGDEFAILTAGCDQAQAAVLAQRIWTEANASKLEIKGEVLHLSVSIGIAGFPAHGTTIEEVLGKADKAMYDAKNAGKNRIVPAALPEITA
jgi:diguanylate cyclase (GGDEF)-like protein/PAS domain S-box-containing protein